MQNLKAKTEDKTFTLYNDDCLNVLKQFPDNSIDACVTDPPYGLSFMGKRWDYDVPSVEIWSEVLRVLKPGGHLLAFAGTRTQHRMAVRIEDAGFEIRDMIAWIYGSGFPKSHDVSKGIDKTFKVEREVINQRFGAKNNSIESTAVSFAKGSCRYRPEFNVTRPSSVEAKYWNGWGTALKPSIEPITVARKPLKATVADNVLEYGTGALNIDACRVGTQTKTNANQPKAERNGFVKGFVSGTETVIHEYGRWPANVIHDGSDEVIELFPYTKSGTLNTEKINSKNNVYGKRPQELNGYYESNSGSAARFFYCAKASKADRDEGLQDIEPSKVVTFQTANGTSGKASSISEGRNTEYRNIHPTVKPTNLMRYLCKLITHKDGVILDPFMGSGSTGKAAMFEGFKFIGIEMNKEYFDIALKRIEAAHNSRQQMLNL